MQTTAVGMRQDLLDLRDLCIKRLSASTDRLERQMVTHFLTTVGSSRTPVFLNRRARHGRHRRLGGLWSWQSTSDIEKGLAAILIGFASSEEPGGSGRYWIRLGRNNHKSLVFVLLLWDWLQHSPWLLAMAKNRTLASQCDRRLTYWKGWRKIIETMQTKFPALWVEYSDRRYGVGDFWTYRGNYV